MEGSQATKFLFAASSPIALQTAQSFTTNLIQNAGLQGTLKKNSIATSDKSKRPMKSKERAPAHSLTGSPTTIKHGPFLLGIAKKRKDTGEDPRSVAHVRKQCT